MRVGRDVEVVAVEAGAACPNAEVVAVEVVAVVGGDAAALGVGGADLRDALPVGGAVGIGAAELGAEPLGELGIGDVAVAAGAAGIGGAGRSDWVAGDLLNGRVGRRACLGIGFGVCNGGIGGRVGGAVGAAGVSSGGIGTARGACACRRVGGAGCEGAQEEE